FMDGSETCAICVRSVLQTLSSFGVQRRPSLGKYQRSSSGSRGAQPERLVAVSQHRVALTRKGVADADIAMREGAVGIEIERPLRAAPGLFVPAREHLVDRQDRVGGCVAVVETDRLSLIGPEPCNEHLAR